ncbi:MBOAT, membrane-bound O-acyltransferase family-domain-containing protein [Sporodiniella umbellata]|nr:MBOAT, membrane-bound O-acyltransferase family-domain-containing protein [Sporodiniella umbellata]
MNPVTSLLSLITGLPEPTLRLLLTLLLGYPTGYFYQKHYASRDRESRNQYILYSGLALNFFFNGFQIYHSLITIGISYSLCSLFHAQRTWAVAGIWVFNAAYLLIGYKVMETEEYDITWTMTQCILCLRMMGFGFDFYDGQFPSAPGKNLPLSFQEDTPLKELPSLPYLFAYGLYPSAFLVGPQFSYSLYHKWLGYPPITDNEETKRSQEAHIVRSVLLGVIYLAVQQLIGTQYSTSYLLTDEYLAFPFYKRVFFFCLAGKFVFNKYIGIYLLNEGATASFGISYSGFDSEGSAKFNGLANVLPYEFETAQTLTEVIATFNINTNLWSKYYVFKRLRFLGSKMASQFGTLAFLAIWHGFHPVYFSTFILEFLFTTCEAIFQKRLVPKVLQTKISPTLWSILTWLACQTTVAYGIVGLELLTFDRAWRAYKGVGFLGHWIAFIVLSGNAFLKKNKRKQQ